MICDYIVTLLDGGIPQEFRIPAVDTAVYDNDAKVVQYVKDLVNEARNGGDSHKIPGVAQLLTYITHPDFKPQAIKVLASLVTDTGPEQVILKNDLLRSQGNVEIGTLKSSLLANINQSPYGPLLNELIATIPNSAQPFIHITSEPILFKGIAADGIYIRSSSNGLSRIQITTHGEPVTSLDTVLANAKHSKILAHELIHYRTNGVITALPLEHESMQLLQGLMDEVYKELQPLNGKSKELQHIVNTIYSTYSVDPSQNTRARMKEFIAYAMTEPEFQRELNKITVQGSKQTFTMFEILKKWLTTVLGITVNRGKALEEVLNITTNFLDIDKQGDIIRFDEVDVVPEENPKPTSDLTPKQPAVEPTIEGTTKFSYNGKEIATEYALGEDQEAALKSLIDFVKTPGSNGITLQGAAGTGKTTIIGYLQKYLGGSNTFAYLAPTHAATAELAFATVKTGNNTLPSTLSSALTVNKAKQNVFSSKITKQLGAGAVIVIDESSMIDLSDVERLMEAASHTGAKVIYLGDEKQIPKVVTGDVSSKQVSPAFTKFKNVRLTKIFRQSDNALLQVLSRMRDSTQFAMYKPISNRDNLKYLPLSDFNTELNKDLKEDPQNTVMVSYTNDSVKGHNERMRATLGRTGPTVVNDIVMGYLGYANKQIEKGDVANSLSYVIKSMEKQGSGVNLVTFSSKLDKLVQAGINGVRSEANTRYLQLAKNDSLNFNLTEEDYENNNKEISAKFARIHKLNEDMAANNIKYGTYLDAMRDASEPLAFYSLGADYIYNPATQRMEPHNFNSHRGLKSNGNGSLLMSKGIDYGHAITIHKSQGSTIGNVYFDASSLGNTKDTPVKNAEGEQITTEKQTLAYVAMSRSKNKLVVNTSGSSFDTIEIKKEEVPSTPVEVKKINIYAGTGENAHLSNFANRPFEYEGMRYGNVEAAFQRRKIGFADQITQQPLAIQTAKWNTLTGAQAKALGRQIVGLRISQWDAQASDLMKKLLLASFGQNAEEAGKLLDTGDAELTHTQDTGKWSTEFPRLLMEVREELKAQDDPLFAVKDKNNIFVKPVPGFTKENVKERAKRVNAAYKANRELSEGNNYNTFAYNYGYAQKITNEVQIVNLKEGDLVLYPYGLKWDKEKGEAVANPKETKFQYGPILYSYFDEAKGKTMVVIAMSNGEGGYTIPADLITYKRDYYGQILADEKKVSQGDLKLVYEKHQSLKYSDKESIKESAFRVHKSDKGYTFYTAINKNAFGFKLDADSESGQELYDNLGENDIVEVEFENYNKDTKKTSKYTGMYAVVRQLGSAVELVTYDKETDTYKTFLKSKSSIRQVILLKENHGNFLDQAKDAIMMLKDRSKNDTPFSKNPVIKRVLFRKIDKEGNVQEVGDKGSILEIDKLISHDEQPAYKEWRKEIKNKEFDKDKLSDKEKRFYTYMTRLESRKASISKLKAGNYVQIQRFANVFDKDTQTWKTGKLYTNWATVVATSAHKVYYVIYIPKDGKPVDHPDNYVMESADITTLNAAEKHPAIVSIGYNNSKEKALIDDFQRIRSTVEKNFQILNGVFKTIKDGGNIDQDAFGKLNVKERNTNKYSSTGEFQDAEDYSKLSDRFYIEHFNTDSPTAAESHAKAKEIAKLQRGDMIMINISKGRSLSKVVLDIDKEGLPIVGGYIPKMKKTGVNGDYEDQDHYLVQHITFDRIIAVGKNIIKNKALGVEGNQDLIEKLESSRNDYLNAKGYKSFATAQEAKDYISKGKFKDENWNVVEITTVERGGKMVKALKPKEGDRKTSVPSIYAIAKTSTNQLFNDKNVYQEVWNAKAMPSEDVFKDLEIFDTVSTSYVKNGKTEYLKGIITKKTASGIHAEVNYIKDGKMLRFPFTLIKYSKNGTNKKGFPSLTEFAFSSRNRGVDKAKALRDKYIKIGAENKGNEANIFSKTTDKFIKSTDSSTLIEALSDKLSKMYGIEIQNLSEKDIATQFDNNSEHEMAKYSDKRAFVIGDKIYINTDRASIAEPLHEMGHIVLRAIESTNPNLYRNIISVAKTYPRYKDIASHYPELEGDRLDEEVFVSIFGERYRDHLKPNSVEVWQEQNKGFFAKIFDHIKGFFKNLLGIDSDTYEELNEADFMSKSLDSMIVDFGAKLMEGRYSSYIDEYASKPATQSRLKQSLINSNLLTELC